MGPKLINTEQQQFALNDIDLRQNLGLASRALIALQAGDFHLNEKGNFLDSNL